MLYTNWYILFYVLNSRSGEYKYVNVKVPMNAVNKKAETEESIKPIINPKIGYQYMCQKQWHSGNNCGSANFRWR